MRTIVIAVLLLLLSSAAVEAQQRIPSMQPPLPACDALPCSGLNEVAALNLSKRYRENLVPDAAILQSIRWLDLSANKLTALPAWVCECANLEYLDISRNRIHLLPECMGKLTRLRTLTANRNPLGTLPAAMATCSSLEYLDLWQTWMDYVPYELRVLDGKLRTVDLRGIRMTMEQQMAIKKVWRETDVWMSAWCNCKPRRKR